MDEVLLEVERECERLIVKEKLDTKQLLLAMQGAIGDLDRYEGDFKGGRKALITTLALLVIAVKIQDRGEQCLE